jgi:predicted ATPase
MEAGGAASFTGRRTARPRQQTLRALLDWSYGLLPETERRILRRLAVFSGGFTADAAVAVAGDADQPPSVVIDAISRLVAKSLVVGDVAEVGPRWKLLETTRLHALERLAAEGERDDAAQRHAEFFRDFLTRFAGASHAATDQTATWQREIHNIRAALDATLTQGGDTALGVVLTAACVPVWTRLSLMAECRDRIERALARLAQDTSGPESSGPHARLEERLRLQLALGVALIYTTGLAARTEDVLDGALRLAERLGDVDFQLRAHWAIWTFNSTVGVYRQAADAARRFAVAAGRSADPADALIGDRLLGNVLHFMGNQTAARHLLDRVVGSPAAAGGRHTMLFDVDQHVVARAIRARVLWLQGLLDEAWQEAQQSLQQARALRQALAVCYGLIEAVCPIALALGKPAEAERAIADLEETVTRHGLTFWAAQARCLRGSLLVAQGRFEAASALLQAELRVFPGRARHYSGFPGDLAQAQAGIGDIAGALATLDQALLRFDRDGVSWCAADALRLKGELLRRGDGGVRAIAAAERCLVAAIDTARRQGALFWELRAATSLARLLAGSGDRDAARTTLAPVAARFTQGLAMPDMVAAAALLRDLDAGETASL